MNKIESAISFALEAHSGSCRKGTSTPYILHPLEAAAIASSITNDEDVIAAAVLHDVIEDTQYSTSTYRFTINANGLEDIDHTWNIQ